MGTNRPCRTGNQRHGSFEGFLRALGLTRNDGMIGLFCENARCNLRGRDHNRYRYRRRKTLPEHLKDNYVAQLPYTSLTRAFALWRRVLVHPPMDNSSRMSPTTLSLILGLELVTHSTKSDANNVAMMNLRAGVLIADFKPISCTNRHLPATAAVGEAPGSQRLKAGWCDDFQREGMTRLR